MSMEKTFWYAEGKIISEADNAVYLYIIFGS